MKKFGFKIEKKITRGLGRAGILETSHGIIHTPAFVPVATKATVKSLTPEQILETGAEAILGNTYHLYLQPGDEIVREAGGLGRFMNWQGPTMTDSGGFQAFSLGAAYGKEISKIVTLTDPSFLIPERADETNLPRLAKVGEDGVCFKSHLDGSLHYITPERSIEIQHNLSADIIFAFDECTSPAESPDYQKEALNRTHLWAKRSFDRHHSLIRANKRIDNPALFGIVQGGRDEGLRKLSTREISSIDFDGFGIGGSFVKEDMSSAVKWVNEALPEDRPRHLLGIGEPEDLIMGIENGVDLFDCVAPTRNARNGTLYTRTGKINITNAQYTKQLSPIDLDCGCYTCRSYTAAYISHLFKGKEMLAATLATIHNLYFIIDLVKHLRQAIIDDNFAKFREDFLGSYKQY